MATGPRHAALVPVPGSVYSGEVKPHNEAMSLTIFPHMVSRKSKLQPLTEQELKNIALFKERIEKMAAAQKKYQNIPISKTSVDVNGVVVGFEANTPDVDDIVTLAIKFRFFYADKEPTQFEKVVNLIRRKAADEWARNYIDYIKLWYKDSMKACDTSKKLGHPVTNREIINLWFNSEFFHSEVAKREKLEDVNQNIGECGSLYQLYTAIVRCASHINSFYSVIHKLETGHEYIYTPNHHFRLNK